MQSLDWTSGLEYWTQVFFFLLSVKHIFEQLVVVIVKPGARPQPAFGRLWACAWFTEIVFVKVCVCTYLSTYLPMFVRTHPREQNRLITVKAAFV